MQGASGRPFSLASFPLPMLLSRLTLFVFSTALLSQAQAQSSSGSAPGLPAGGKLDADKVLEARYGASAQDAPAVPDKPKRKRVQRGEAAPDADERGEAPGDRRAISGARQAVQRVAGSQVTVAIDNTDGGAPGEMVPVTFGQVFAPGAVKRGQTLVGKIAEGGQVALQVDPKASHPDGSLRHAVISALLPRPAPGKPAMLGLSAAEAAAEARAGAPDARTIAVTVSAVIKGKHYAASVERPPAQGKGERWLDGPIASEWHATVPLRTAAGEVHPHMVARFALRSYAGKRTRVDVTVENNWAYEPGPANVAYDADIAIDGASVWSKPDLNHYHHTRWRKLFWVGGAPGVEVRHDPQDLIASRAVPRYDPSLRIAEKTLAGYASNWQGARTEPMATGLAARTMSTTGGRPDIGLLPGWTAAFVVSGDPRARRVTLGTADLAGSYPAHFRDKRTGYPVSLLDYPYMTILGHANHTLNPATGKREAFPACADGADCGVPNRPDVSHQPSFAYVPYLVTGDYYYLEELQFWAMFNAFSSNPQYRESRKGLLKSYQVRGQAWALRTIAHAAYITPDAHPLKRHFIQIVDSNLDWYAARYINNPKANKLGFVEENYAIVYRGKTGLAPWQDDFFTSAVGHVAELGFEKARPLLAWKAKFPVGRMTGDGMCWITASMYSMKVRDAIGAPFYDSFAQVYRNSYPSEVAGLDCASPDLAARLELKPGEMPGYAHSASGFPSNLQPALAYSADAAGKAGQLAWERFMSRRVKPDYSTAPQFAIVPRSESSAGEEVQQR